MVEGGITADATAGGTLPGAKRMRCPPIAAGSILRHYEVIRPLGSGGMGTVYLARDRSLGRLVAIKFINELTNARTSRFLVEARAMARINHPNIIVIHELGEHFDQPYIVLEYLEGQTFEELLAERRATRAAQPGDERAGLSVARTVDLIVPVVRALVCAHQQGIIHRDLKPANIILTDTGIVKVLDFGIAKFEDPQVTSEERYASDDNTGEKKPA